MISNKLILVSLVLYISCSNPVKEVKVAAPVDLAISEIVIESDTLIRQFRQMKIDSLIQAAVDNNLELASSLINRCVDVNGKTFRGRNYWDSPLSEAIRRNNGDMVKLLVE